MNKRIIKKHRKSSAYAEGAMIIATSIQTCLYGDSYFESEKEEFFLGLKNNDPIRVEKSLARIASFIEEWGIGNFPMPTNRHLRLTRRRCKRGLTIPMLKSLIPDWYERL